MSQPLTTGRDEAISSAPDLVGDEETRNTLAAYPVFQIQARRPPLAPSFADSDYGSEGCVFESRRVHGKWLAVGSSPFAVCRIPPMALSSILGRLYPSWPSLFGRHFNFVRPLRRSEVFLRLLKRKAEALKARVCAPAFS
jgi:hypothetical protein